MKNIIILLAMCLWPLLGMAQQAYNMAGVAYDETWQILVGATVFLKSGVSLGTMTDENGAFKIKASKGDVIVLSFIGYNNFEYFVEKEDDHIVVKMEPSAVQME